MSTARRLTHDERKALRRWLVDREAFSLAEVNSFLASIDCPLQAASQGPVYSFLYAEGYRKPYGAPAFCLRDSRVQAAAKPIPYVPTPAPVRSALVRLPAAEPVPSVAFEDGEPRVRDLDLAAYLGFSRSRDIRKLILRHSEEIGDVCSTVARLSGNEVSEYWLTQAQATYIIAKSETPVASNILQRVIQIYIEAKRGGHLPDELANDPIILLRTSQLETERKLRELAAEQARHAEILAGHEPDHYTALGYLRKCGRRDVQPLKLGITASQLLKARGEEPRRVSDARYGSVNQYHLDDLEEALSMLDDQVAS